MWCVYGVVGTCRCASSCQGRGCLSCCSALYGSPCSSVTFQACAQPLDSSQQVRIKKHHDKPYWAVVGQPAMWMLNCVDCVCCVPVCMLCAAMPAAYFQWRGHRNHMVLHGSRMNIICVVICPWSPQTLCPTAAASSRMRHPV